MLRVKKARTAFPTTSKFHNLRDSAIARAKGGLVFGINATRAMTIKGAAADAPDVLSIGRVQTPTLALVAAGTTKSPISSRWIFSQSREISQRIQENFSKILIFPENQAGLDDAGRLVDAAIAKKLVKEFQGKDEQYVVGNGGRENKNRPPLPHCLSSLQKPLPQSWACPRSRFWTRRKSSMRKADHISKRRTAAICLMSNIPEAANVLKALSPLSPALKNRRKRQSRTQKLRLEHQK